MKCPRCSFVNPEGIRFCGKCGAPLSTIEEIRSSQTVTLQLSPRELARGSIFSDRYEVIEELGRGGMGRVYKVLDKEINEEIALKLLNTEIADDTETIERFRNELKLSRKISHRNVCRMFDLNREEDIYFITMEYVSGENLKSLIRKTGQFSIEKALIIARQVSEGLAEAHRLGVVHRDLKPQNIMIDSEGNAHIMDFGIARSLKTEGITETGKIIGTPEYMSPEQIEAEKIDTRSDIYSFGVILYEMVTGKLPFEGRTPISVALKHKTETPSDPREFNAQIPNEISRVILKCMEKEKIMRYQKAEELLKELTDIEKNLFPKISFQPEIKFVLGTQKKQSFLKILPLVAISIIAGYILFSQILSPEKKMKAEKPTESPKQLTQESSIITPQVGYLEISSSPKGAEVYIANKREGITPFKRELKPGTYQIKINKGSKYEEITDILDIKAGKSYSKNYFLPPQKIKTQLGAIEINSNPVGAEVYIDKKFEGKTPFSREIRPGNYSLRLKKEPEYKDFMEVLKVISGETVSKNFTLEPVYILNLNTIPEGADVNINGEYKGKSPLIFELNKSTFQLKIEKGKEWSTIVELLTLKPGINELNRSLERMGYNLLIKTSPDGARVYVGNKLLGTSPLKKSNMYGKHEIKIEKEGFKTIEESINLDSNFEKTYELVKLELTEKSKIKDSKDSVSKERPIKKEVKTELEKKVESTIKTFREGLSLPRIPPKKLYSDKDIKLVDIWNFSGSVFGHAFYPTDITIDNSGYIYVTDKKNASVYKFTKDSKIVENWISNFRVEDKVIYPHGIDVDKSGNIYVCDTSNHRIVKFTKEGKFISNWGTYGKDAGQLDSPTGMAVDKYRNIYVCDTNNHRIVKFTQNGKFISNWGTYGKKEGQLKWPTGIATDNFGYVFVADSGNRRIVKYDSMGNSKKEFGYAYKILPSSSIYGEQPPGKKTLVKPKEPVGLAVDTLGYVFVVDKGINKIFKYSNLGGFLAERGSKGIKPDQFISPQGIALDNKGYIYVADMGNQRIKIYQVK